MRVCFVMSAAPHYITLLINKLVSDYSLEVALIKPNAKSVSVGSGVHEDTDNRLFTLFELEEYKTWYGKSFFRGMKPVLMEYKPDILIAGWPFVLYFTLTPSFRTFLKKSNIKFIHRDIPFNLPAWGEIRQFYFGGGQKNEDFSNLKKSSWIGFLRCWVTTFIRRAYIRSADAHIMYTTDAYHIIGSYGVPQEKIFVTANSPDTDVLLQTYETVKNRPFLWKENPNRLIHIGRLVKWKRVDLIISSLKTLCLKYPDIELIVIGYGPEEENLKKQVLETGMEQYVRFLGGVYDPVALGQHLHESAIYVLAGMGGLSINDAMCFGKPVICSIADGTEKLLVREGENGYYFENGDLKSLTEKIDLLLGDPIKLKQFGQKSLEIIKKEVNIHTVLRRYQAAFDYVISQNEKK